MRDPRAEGKKSEDRAADYLAARGYELVERNFTSRYGEIVLICRDGDTLVFVEVKMRRPSSYGTAEEAVSRAKQRRLINAAEDYLQRSGASEVVAAVRRCGDRPAGRRRSVDPADKERYRDLSAGATVLRSVPRPVISTSTTSPGFRNDFSTAPTPEGVPVAMISPGSSVANWLTQATVSATENIMSPVLACCRTCPLTRSSRSNACGSSISSLSTRNGPVGANVSNHLPLSQSKNGVRGIGFRSAEMFSLRPETSLKLR